MKRILFEPEPVPLTPYALGGLDLDASQRRGVSSVESYVFQAELAEEEDGRWSAWIEALPGCATWGHTKEEALAALQDAAQAYIEVLVQKGQRLPSKKKVQVVDRPLIAVTV